MWLRARLLIACAAVAAMVPLLLSGPHAAAAETPACSSFGDDLLQRVNPSTNANLLTRSSMEADRSAAVYGFTVDKGVLAKVAGADSTGLIAVWRLYKSGDFVWANEGPDADAIVADGYQKQFVEFYAGTGPLSCLAPVYRLTRGGMHRMATGSESNVLVQAGWTLEKIAFYAAPPGAPTVPADVDTKFSLAVIPDTGNETSSTDSRFLNRATWLAANKASLDLRYALQVGDLTNWGNVVPAQFAKASADIAPLEAALPWAGAIGNHDTAAVCVGGSACPGMDASKTVRDTTAYNEAFPVSRFGNIQGTFEPAKVDNAYRTFRAGGVDWLVLNLELWPRSAVVSWAKEVVVSHPNHNVIVLTHAYLEADGSISGSNGGYGATSGTYLFDNLIKVYPNVKLVVTSHVGTSASRTDVGVNGNKILSLLQHFHSSTNPVRLVEIDTAAGMVTSRVYAPYTDTSYPNFSTSTSGMTFVN